MNVTDEMIDAFVSRSSVAPGDMRECVRSGLEAAFAVREKLTRDQIRKLVDDGKIFVDTNPEADWLAAAEMACPHCGGSGHKDDVRPLSLAPQVKETPPPSSHVAAAEHPIVAADRVYKVLKRYRDQGRFDWDHIGYICRDVAALVEERKRALESAAKVADNAKDMRERLFAENGASLNASKAVQAEEIAAAIRSLMEEPE